MCLNDEIPDGPRTVYAVMLAFFVVALMMMATIFFLTGCSHSMESSIGNKDQNVSLGFNVELKHKKDEDN